MKRFIFLLGALLMPHHLLASDKLLVHYSRLAGDHAGWNLWTWNDEDRQPGFDLLPAGRDAFGVVYELDLAASGLKGKRLGLLPRRGEWTQKDAPDRLLASAQPGHVYLLEGDKQIYSAPPEISTGITGAYLDSSGEVRVTFTRPLGKAFLARQAFYLTRGENAFHPLKAEPVGGEYSRAALLAFDSLGTPDYKGLNAGAYRLHSRDFKPVPVALGGAVYGADFRPRQAMGLTRSGGSAVLRIFAPYAVKAEALIYGAGQAKPQAHALVPREGGVWEKEFSETLEGKSYRLRVTQGGKVYEGLDPYARCVTADDGRALVFDDATPVAPGPQFPLAETVIYEVHLRDLTMDAFSGVKAKGKYLGAAEAGTRHPSFPEISTGLDHIAELGVNAVHILPFQDFQNGDSTSTYDWGYMPVNFNSPEGSYATNPSDASRVREAKLMIDAFHRKGLKVIMDVVYNHTAETRDRVYNFNALAMDYYYRLNADGSYSNGSGCGNEFRTEAPVARRFLIDSLLYWVNEYKVDGFRFDLMGLIDLDAVAEALRELRRVKPDILVYGEPWTAGLTPARGVKKGSQRGKGFPVFNDHFRDAIKGSVFSLEDLGYVQAARNRDAVMRGIRGSVDDFTDGPLETLNYVSCHDNHTLWDRIDLSLKEETQENKERMARLANALVLTSQGVPFLHAGEEFLRTKKGEENSYNLPDEINRLDWSRKKEKLGVFNYYKDLIALRREHPAFRLTTAAAVREDLKFYEEIGLKVEPPGIAYLLYGDRAGDSWERILVLVNPEKTPRSFALPMGKWTRVFDAAGLVREPAAPVSGTYEAQPLSLTVLKL